MLKRFILGLSGVILMLAWAAPSFADETALASLLHDWRKERGKVCMVGHFHSGSSNGLLPSKRQAMAAAVSSWRGFTAMEYGSDWGSFRLAGSKSKSCVKSGKSWTCSVEARPCKRPRRVKRRYRRRGKRR